MSDLPSRPATSSRWRPFFTALWRHDSWLRGWLGGRFLPYQLAAAAALLLAPTITSGLYLDDFAQRLAVEHPERVPLARLDLFAVISQQPELRSELKELGVYFWWIGPDTKVAYWRPLAALTHVFDYSVWPHWAWLMHLENFAWYAALIVACAGLYRRFVPVAWVAGLAVDMYAFDPSHAGPVAWIANRNALMSTLFGVLALLAHDAWRRGRRRAFAFAAPALLLLALLSAESGIAIAGYLVAYALCIDREERAGRILSLAPGAFVIVVWRAVYVALGHGIASSGAIADPLVDPIGFAQRAAQSIPIQLASALTTLSPDVLTRHPRALAVGAVVATALLVLVGRAFWAVLRRDDVARFFAVGALLSSLPLGATLPSDRHLFWVGIGAIGLVSKVAEALDARRVGIPVPRGLQGWIGGALIVCRAGTPFAFALRGEGPSVMQYSLERVAATLPNDAATPGQTVVVLNAPVDVFASVVPVLCIAKGKPFPKHMYFLYAGRDDLTVSRVDADALDVRPRRGWMPDVTERSYRSEPFRAGEVVDMARMRAEVRALTPDRRADDVRFTFTENLDDPSLVWMQWGARGLERVAPPRVGEAMYVAAAPLLLDGAQAVMARRKAIEPD
jgi:hypothetical protein